MNHIAYKEAKKTEKQVRKQGDRDPKIKLANLLFSVWKSDRMEGHSSFTGDAHETARYLTSCKPEQLEVSALDLELMRSLEPIGADHWLHWYYQTALSLLEEHNFDETVLVPYPTNSIGIEFRL